MPTRQRRAIDGSAATHALRARKRLIDQRCPRHDRELACSGTVFRNRPGHAVRLSPASVWGKWSRLQQHFGEGYCSVGTVKSPYSRSVAEVGHDMHQFSRVSFHRCWDTRLCYDLHAVLICPLWPPKGISSSLNPLRRVSFFTVASARRSAAGLNSRRRRTGFRPSKATLRSGEQVSRRW